MVSTYTSNTETPFTLPMPVNNWTTLKHCLCNLYQPIPALHLTDSTASKVCEPSGPAALLQLNSD